MNKIAYCRSRSNWLKRLRKNDRKKKNGLREKSRSDFWRRNLNVQFAFARRKMTTSSCLRIVATLVTFLAIKVTFAPSWKIKDCSINV
jgi:hypothetical protein